MGGVCSGTQKLQAKSASVSKTTTIPQRKWLLRKNTEERPVLARSRTLNLKKAVEIVGKSVLKSDNGGGTKISILSFEVANIIGKGRNLVESVAEKKLGILKEVLGSDGVQNLVSTDINLLLMIAADDKRDELNAFVKEVIRFGDLCKDPQWHNLGLKLDSNDFIRSISKEESEATMHELRVLGRHTAELYRELIALDRLEHDYKQKLEEVNSFLLPLKAVGDDLEILKNEVKLQRKLVNSLKKKSLWCKSMEEIMVKLLDVISYLHQRFTQMSVKSGSIFHEEKDDNNRTSQPLGPAGLALHYANIIIQINTISSSPTCLSPKVRDSLYRSLPDGVKTSLYSRLRVAGADEQLGISHIKDEMDKTSKWLLPAATNTINLHQKFGWVGDWAMASAEKKKGAEIIRLQTLYHADKAKTERYILEQVTLLHHLIKLAKRRVNVISPLPIRPSNKRNPNLHRKVPPVDTDITPKPTSSNKLSRVCPLGQSLKAHQATPDFMIGQFKF